jgi:hypothetical protein
MPNDVTFMFTPFWLFALKDDERDQVQQWLNTSGINLDMCPGFDYDGGLITTRYYAKNEMGSPMVDTSGDVVYEDQVREFYAPNAPKAVQEWRHRA